MNDTNKDDIVKKFRKIILAVEKENLSQLQQKGDSLIVEKLKNEFEKVVKEYENN